MRKAPRADLRPGPGGPPPLPPRLACQAYPSNWAGGPRFIIGLVLYLAGTAINR